jgi:hypothetical protein
MRKTRSRTSKGKWIAIILGGLLIALVLGLLILKYRLESWLRSEEFRRMLSQKTSGALNVEAEFSPLQWQGAEVYSDRFNGRGKPGSPVLSLDALRIRTSLLWREIFSGAWRTDDFHIGQLTVEFNPYVGMGAVNAMPEGSLTANEPEQPAQQSLPSWLPQRFEPGTLYVDKADFRFGSFSLSGTSLEAKAGNTGWVVECRGGKISAPALPPLTLDSARLRITKNALHLISANARADKVGTLRAEGSLSAPPARELSAVIEWSGFDIRSILPDEWRPYLSGAFSGNASLIGSANSPSEIEINGCFAVRDGTLEGFGLLSALSTFTKSPRFLRIPLHEISLDFSHARAATAVRNLVVESKGLMRVEGAFDVASNNSLMGELEIGLTPQTLQWLPGSQERIFTISRDGYLWTPVRIGGSVQNPTEDLSSRLLLAAGQKILDAGKQTGGEVIEKGVESAAEGVRKAIDLFSPILLP